MDTSGPNGSTENATIAGIVEMIGASQYTLRSAVSGMICSLNGSLIASATDCSQPFGPTRLGPGRCCILATTLRSQTIMNVVRIGPSSSRITTLIRINQI